MLNALGSRLLTPALTLVLGVALVGAPDATAAHGAGFDPLP
jgi:hypothetical protein